MLTATFEGPPFERGYQHGRQFAAEIRESIRVFCPEDWRSSAGVKELERRLLTSISAQAPHLVLEMAGISKGAGIDFDQITLLNLVLATNDLSSGDVSRTFKLACSAIGFADAEAGPIVGKNCDETPAAAPFYLLETVYPGDGLAYTCISWTGTLWAEAGMNEAGLAFMQTAGPLVPDQDGYGIVCNIAPRPLLEHCRTVPAAVNMLAEMTVAGWGMGMVLADARGNVVAVEKSYASQAVRPAADGVAFCTNHFVEPAMSDTVPIAHEGLVPNSEARYRTLTKLFAERAWPHTPDGLQKALGYHGEEGFVCQHGDAGLHTNYSCIAIPRLRQIWLGDGYPCEGRYTVHQL